MRRRLFWQLAATYLAVVVLCTGTVGWYSIRSAHEFYLKHTQTELLARARIVQGLLPATIGTWDTARLETLLRGLGAASGTRFTIINPKGHVLADSQHDPTTMQNHSDRPEVKAALAGHVGMATRTSPTLGVAETYVAIPFTQDGQTVAVVRAAVPLTSVNAALHSLYWRIGISAGIIAVISAALGFLVARRISRRMREIKRGAERYASGDFGYKLDVSRTEEFAGVAESLNRMAGQLDEQIRTVTDQSNEREAILSSMVEGVLAVDTDERVLTVNRAAVALLGVEAEQVHGRSIQEVVRNTELQKLIARSLAEHRQVEGELTLRTNGRDRYVQVSCAVLQGDGGQSIGAIAVLNDVSRLKALESMRREFVANVSHEIKTPVTSIKGFAETLLDGAKDEPAEVERFLRIIVGQSDRLNSIVEDLLSLSSVEQAAGGGSVELQEGSLSDVVRVAVEVCDAKARAKGISLVLDVPEDAYAIINPPLLEQAVVNLVDNAIKYSPEDSTVEVRLTVVDGNATIEVRDHGLGISRQHLPHLFERFYRVDKARSRTLGGTGLGLAIVKHIAEAHNGSVSVQSTVGEGSVFAIRLPAPA
jgi:two-component system, OmpR family, phosphate regulon sensor histidine kinase PhoR